MRTLNNIIFFLLLIFFVSCDVKQEKEEGSDNLPPVISAHQVVLDQSQIDAIGLKTGTIEKRNLSDLVRANGYVDVPPQNIAVISPYVKGYINKVHFMVGDRVKKGAVVAVLESIEYLEIQQKFIELEGRLEYLENEWERQEILLKENAVSKKRYLQASSEYKTALSGYKGLKEQLKLMGANFDMLSSGEVDARLYIKSPINGLVTQVNGVIGQYIDPQEEIFKIINTDHLHLELNVFEKDILKVREGQKVIFSVPNMGGQSYFGKVFLVAQSLEPHQRYIQVHVHMDDERAPCKVGMYVNASIVVDDLPVSALPVRAVVTQGEKEFVFVGKKKSDGHNVFEKREVVTGVHDQNYVEIKFIQDMDLNDEIVTEGAFYLSNAFDQGGE